MQLFIIYNILLIWLPVSIFTLQKEEKWKEQRLKGIKYYSYKFMYFSAFCGSTRRPTTMSKIPFAYANKYGQISNAWKAMPHINLHK